MQAKVPAPLSVAAVDSPVQVAVSFIPVSSIETGLVECCLTFDHRKILPATESCRASRDVVQAYDKFSVLFAA
jgi:hypothetical protein